MKIFLCVLSLVSAGLIFAGEPVELKREGGVLKGTLILPEVENPVLVVLHSGSGPTDRDGNQPGMSNNSLKMLAEGLSEAGFATLRYDKRGLGDGIPVDEIDLRPGTYIDDLAAWVSWAHADGRFGPIVLLGHSEGALFAKAAAAQADVDAVISLAGSGRPAGVLLREQVAGQLPPNLAGDFERILATLEGGELVEDTPPVLQAMFRPSVQPYMRDWLGMDPAELAASMNVPLLIVGGSTDVQVSRTDFDRLTAATNNGQSAWIAGMNHVLKPVEGALAEQVPSYMDPDMALHPELLPEISRFLSGIATAATE